MPAPDRCFAVRRPRARAPLRRSAAPAPRTRALLRVYQLRSPRATAPSGPAGAAGLLFQWPLPSEEALVERLRGGRGSALPGGEGEPVPHLPPRACASSARRAAAGCSTSAPTAASSRTSRGEAGFQRGGARAVPLGGRARARPRASTIARADARRRAPPSGARYDVDHDVGRDRAPAGSAARARGGASRSLAPGGRLHLSTIDASSLVARALGRAGRGSCTCTSSTSTGGTSRRCSRTWASASSTRGTTCTRSRRATCCASSRRASRRAAPRVPARGPRRAARARDPGVASATTWRSRPSGRV